MHPEDIVKFLPIYLDAFRRRLPFEIRARLLHRDGTWRWVRMHGAPSFAAAGTFEGFSGSCAVLAGDGAGVPASSGEWGP
jgi:hypothetical protein